MTSTTRWGAILLTLFSTTGPLPVAGQEGPVMTLFRTTWEEGVEAAGVLYRDLPEATRSPSLLVQVADQLLWTGKSAEALRLLELADTGPSADPNVAFQQGRAHLQRGEPAAALASFRRGLIAVTSDSAASPSERDRLRRRLENRIRLLERAEELTASMDAYRAKDGTLHLFRFDPYINTFPTLVEPESGRVRILYPGERGDLFWRDTAGDSVGSVSFRGGNGAERALVLRTRSGEVRATGLGIRQELVRYEAGGASVEGTLFRPASSEPVPAVVLTHGAGLSSRYNLAVEALAFASEGVAALVYDKPGLGRSTGGNWLLLSIPDQATYVDRAVAELEKRPDVTRLGVWGFSQGGWVAPLTASRSDVVSFVVTASGAAVGPQEQSLQATVLRLKADGASRDEIDAAVEYSREMWARVNDGAQLEEFTDLEARLQGAPWRDYVQQMRMQFEIDWWRANEIDAGTVLRGMDVPVLALFGEGDENVPPRDNVPILARLLAEAPTGDYTIAVLPGANHQLMQDDDYSPLYFRTMTDWVTDRFGASPPSGGSR